MPDACSYGTGTHMDSKLDLLHILAFVFLIGSIVGVVSVFLPWIDAGSVSCSGWDLFSDRGGMEEIGMDNIGIFVPLIVLIFSLAGLGSAFCAYRGSAGWAQAIASNAGLLMIFAFLLFFRVVPDTVDVSFGVHLAIAASIALFGGSILIRVDDFIARRRSR
ncbi:MAG: hypothetical protein LBT41_00175 [Candidatus Methanoplasma sp.]|jgi:hypothetical protein|nr:hypothetical protein [Candidatus Methanoplasma sp.]